MLPIASLSKFNREKAFIQVAKQAGEKLAEVDEVIKKYLAEVERVIENIRTEAQKAVEELKCFKKHQGELFEAGLLEVMGTLMEEKPRFQSLYGSYFRALMESQKPIQLWPSLQISTHYDANEALISIIDLLNRPICQFTCK